MRVDHAKSAGQARVGATAEVGPGDDRGSDQPIGHRVEAGHPESQPPQPRHEVWQGVQLVEVVRVGARTAEAEGEVDHRHLAEPSQPTSRQAPR